MKEKILLKMVVITHLDTSAQNLWTGTLKMGE